VWELLCLLLKICSLIAGFAVWVFLFALEPPRWCIVMASSVASLSSAPCAYSHYPHSTLQLPHFGMIFALGVAVAVVMWMGLARFFAGVCKCPCVLCCKRILLVPTSKLPLLFSVTDIGPFLPCVFCCLCVCIVLRSMVAVSVQWEVPVGPGARMGGRNREF
jgi:hypothetical protein